MTITVLTAEEVGLPAFDVNPTETADVCHRSGHERARGDRVRAFDRRPRIQCLRCWRRPKLPYTAIMSFLRQHCADPQPVHDWV